MITFSDVSFTYTGETKVLSELALSIEEGQFVCILGANGSGKSTFSKLINALLVPDTGIVTVNNLETNNPDNTFAIRSTAGAVFQNPDDQIVASLVENDVAFGPENLGIENPELRQRVEESLAKVGLAGSGKRETTALSGGQKQRVAIAGVLAMHPSILIFDEASAMLDPRTGHDRYHDHSLHGRSRRGRSRDRTERWPLRTRRHSRRSAYAGPRSSRP